MEVSSKQNASSQMYADFTLSRIAPHVRRSLTDEQYKAIRSALVATEVEQKHSFDMRLSIPLYLRSYYFIVFAGRDRRRSTLELERRVALRYPKILRQAVLLMATASAILTVLFGMFIVLYLVKSSLGVDLFKDIHLYDIVPLEFFKFGKSS